LKLAALCPNEISQVPAVCMTSVRWPFAVIAPRRICGSGLAVAANSTVPSPCPLAPDLMLSHVPSTDADQAHSRAAVRLMEAVPPVAGKGVSRPCIDIAHRLIDVGDVIVVAAEPPHEERPSNKTGPRAAVAIRLSAIRLRSKVRIC